MSTIERQRPVRFSLFIRVMKLTAKRNLTGLQRQVIIDTTLLSIQFNFPLMFDSIYYI